MGTEQDFNIGVGVSDPDPFDSSPMACLITEFNQLTVGFLMKTLQFMRSLGFI